MKHMKGKKWIRKTIAEKGHSEFDFRWADGEFMVSMVV